MSQCHSYLHKFAYSDEYKAHQDHGREYINELKGLLAEMPPSAAAKLAGQTVAGLYKL